MSRVIDNLSAVAFRIQTLRDAMPIGAATGFLYRSVSGSIFLLTNYHVLSGYNPLTGQPLHPQAALPNRVTFHLPTRREIDDGSVAFQYVCLQRELLSDDSTPLWQAHPRLGNTADVAALDIGIKEDIRCWTINDAIQEHVFDDFILRPGLDVFVIGFPLGLSVAKHLAIWKRGTIASEPMFDFDDKPRILIDTATRSGMSGAPVIAQIQGLWGGTAKEGGHISTDTRIGTGRKFVGIYSNRLGSDEFQAQLGIVWKRTLIEEVVESGEMLDMKTARDALPAQDGTIVP